MKNSREALVTELMSQLNEEERMLCGRIVDCLSDLDYRPYRENVRGYVLSFKNKDVRQTIAKLGVRTGKNKGIFCSLKFYACKNPPEKFTNAVNDAVLKTNGQYRCSDCGVCGAAEGERGYRCALPGGTKFLRCGAYAVEIPELTPEDIDSFISLLNEQHRYFTARIKRTV